MMRMDEDAKETEEKESENNEEQPEEDEQQDGQEGLQVPMSFKEMLLRCEEQAESQHVSKSI